MANKYATGGQFATRKLQSLGWTPEDSSTKLGRHAHYMEGIIRGNYPLTRGLTDQIDLVTGQPQGSTWVEYQRFLAEVSK